MLRPGTVEDYPSALAPTFLSAGGNRLAAQGARWRTLYIKALVDRGR